MGLAIARKKKFPMTSRGLLSMSENYGRLLPETDGAEGLLSNVVSLMHENREIRESGQRILSIEGPRNEVI